MSQERRRYPRAPLHAEILCENLPGGSNRGRGVICFYSTDISVGGLFLETTIPFQEGHIIHIQLKLPGAERPLRLQGRVVRNVSSPPETAPGMAIEFLHLGYEDQRLIEGYVRGSEEAAPEKEGEAL